MSKNALHQIPVTELKGVGQKVAKKLAKIQIHTLQDLLFHLPSRYQDRTQVHPIASLHHGAEVVVEVIVDSSQIKQGRKRMLLVQVSDQSGTLLLRFFHFGMALQSDFKKQTAVRCFGEVRLGNQGFEIMHPEYQIMDQSDTGLDKALTPIYPTTEGLQQQTFRNLTDKALAWLNEKNGLTEWLPTVLLDKKKLISLADAVNHLHRPPPSVNLFDLTEGQDPAQQRLVFEELLAHQLSLKQLRIKQQSIKAPALIHQGKLWQTLLSQLPFQPTNAQKRVNQEIRDDLQQSHPMMRLLQGDVGAGKTLVAVHAALQAIEAGYQVAIMAPTSLLAEQLFINFQQWLAPLQRTFITLTGKDKGKKRRLITQQIRDHEIDCIVGTHALFQDDVHYAKLGLVIIDEQHRFGVEQRMALRKKGEIQGFMPHQLLMTATPIPRTLAMSAYADLAISVINELPPGRSPVKTVVLPNSRRADVMERLRLACQEGRQAYWVCTLVEESEILQCQAAEETAELLIKELPELNIGLVHGRLKALEKNQIMASFKQHQFDLLIATTVIEVGVDVPNASLMIIENPERLGLAQLHQLRGRVGRGKAQSYCILMYQPPLSYPGKQRLGTLRKTNDGFMIAQKDLELRGAGEVLGTKQTGAVDFKIADLLRDQSALENATKTADWLLENYPKVVKPIIQRWLVDKEKYAHI